MNDDQRHPVEILAEEFADRLRSDQQPSIEEYVSRYPEHAEMIMAIFPPIAMMEQAREVHASSSRLSSRTSSSNLPSNKTQIPDRLGDFQLLREIGRGGMGVVFEAVQQSLKRHVALKVMSDIAAGSAQRRARFIREAEAAAQLHHTNIVGVFGTGEESGYLFYAMQLIQGTPLNEVIAAIKRGDASGMPADATEKKDGSRVNNATDSLGNVATLSSHPTAVPREVLASPVLRPQYFHQVAHLIANVASGLHYAHHLGIFHRDIKPSNLLLDREGAIWITDFGVAKRDSLEDVTQAGEIVGTLRYMAPEQLRGTSNARSDIYSLGLTLFELLTLQPALTATTGSWFETVAKGLIPSPRSIRKDIPRDLEVITLKACAADPAERYATAEALEQDLRRFMEDRPVLARRESVALRIRRIVRRNPAVATLTLALILMLTAVVALLGRGYHLKQQALKKIQLEYDRAEENLQQKTSALVTADHERNRAEKNLSMAIEAFAGVVNNIASRGGSESLLDELGDEDIDLASVDAILSDADVQLLENLMAFFDRFALENGTDLSAQSALATRRVADIQHRLGRLEGAVQSYRKSLEIYRNLAEKHPDNREFQYAQVQIVSEMIVVSAKRGRMGEVLLMYNKAQSLAMQSSLLRDTAEGKLALARLCNTMASLGSRYGGDNRLRPVRNWMRRVMSSPARDVVVSPITTERLKRENEANTMALRLLQELLAEEPQQVAYRLTLARVQREDVRIAQSMREFERAEAALKASIETLEKLIAEYPDVDAFQFELANTLRTGVIYSPADMQRFSRAVRICDHLIQSHPHEVEYRSLRSSALIRVATVQNATGKSDRAIESLKTAYEDQALIADRFPEILVYQIAAAQTLSNLAEVQLNAGDRVAAMQSIDRAIHYGSRGAKNGRNVPFLERLREKKKSLQGDALKKENNDAQPTTIP